MTVLSNKNPLLQALKPLYIISSFVGLAPYIQNNQKIYINNFLVFLKTISILTSHGIIWYFMRYFVALGIGTSMLDKILNIQDNIWSLSVLIHVLVEFVQKNKILQFFKDLQNFDQEIQHIVDLPQSYHKIWTFFTIRLFVVFLFVSSGIYFDYVIYFNFDLWMFWLSLLSYHAFVATTGIFALKFITLNYLMKQRFGLINGFLDESRKRCYNIQVNYIIEIFYFIKFSQG